MSTDTVLVSPVPVVAPPVAPEPALAHAVPAPAPASALHAGVISPEARRLAGTILEVMAGMKSITVAALALGVTTARYQQLELRAVSGLIVACEPRGPGPIPGAGLPCDIERLASERDRLKAELGRYQALVRIAQGAFGTASGQPTMARQSAAAEVPTLPGVRARQALRSRAAATTPVPASKPRKKRQPTVRALRLAKRVRSAETAPGSLLGAASTTSMSGGTPAMSPGR